MSVLIIIFKDIEPYILLANKHYIRKISMDGQTFELVARGFDNVVSMDVDLVENQLYMLDAGKLRIYRIPLDKMGSPINEYQQIVRHNVFGIEGILIFRISNLLFFNSGMSVDWVGRKLYILNRQDRSLRVCELDGRFCRTMIRDRIQQPKAIVVHPKKGYLYFTEWSLQPYIGRVALDGSIEHGDDPIFKLAENDLGWPNALTIDFYSDR